MASHAPLLRTNTAPVWQHSTDGVARLANMNMGSTPRASQLSGSTAFASSSSSLGTLNHSGSLMSPQSNGPVQATSNIINQKADASRSLYQICVALKTRLGLCPGFEGYMTQLEQSEQEGGEDSGPVEGLWKLLKAGVPLLAIYNATDPDEPLDVDSAASATEEKRAKIAAFKFVQACSTVLKIPSQDMFIINDLTGTDTSGFLKVTIVINYVLDIAQQRGLLRQAQMPYPEDDTPAGPVSKMSYRDHIVRELVDTERKYVQDLENLHDLKKVLEQRGALNGDVVHDIFLNINTILDFQRRFLIRIETTNSMPASRQEWGNPFVAYEESFDCYQPFIANQRKAAMLASQVFDKIQTIQHPVACDFNTLDGFLLKPMQRLVKYPLLLKDLLKKSEDEDTKKDLAAGIASAEKALKKANDAVDRDLLDEALQELRDRVDDWKNHRVEQFGNLLLHGVYTVVTGKTDAEKDYEIYLFECILLCCKEIVPNKSKDKKDKTRSTGPKVRNKNAKLQLKGRIFMTNVTEVLSFSKPGSYTVQIWWKGDPGVENFVIKFQNEEMMKKWTTGLDNQRKENAPQSASSPDQPTANFRWMDAQGGDLVNPYAEHDDDEDDYTPPSSSYGAMSGTMPRTASNGSLRQRSIGGESTGSIAGVVRPAPPRFPMALPPSSLSLQTQMNGGLAPQQQPQYSPGPRGGDSYFSPVAESPVSSRTSTTSNFFGPASSYTLPKNGAPTSGWAGDEHQRYTAPAMPRAPSRDGPSPVNAYGMVNGRNPRGPSLPAMASSQSVAQQQRSRSYSTPDINGQPQQPVRRTERGGSQGVPAVPGIPAHLHPAHDGNIPRSSTGSPRQEMPIRTNTQSPGVQRERMQQGYGGGGHMTQFPAQPIHPRQNTPGQAGQAGLFPAPLNLAEATRTMSPAPPSSNPLASPDPNGMPLPTQLKVKVNCDSGNYLTLVANLNITYQSLIDRIDVKLARFTNSSIGKGNLRLRYRDEDGDFVSIESDEDIQIAFSDWREGLRNQYSGGMGEIELFCVGDTA